METEIHRIVSLLKLTFEKGAWHGPTVKEVLQGITQNHSLRKLPNTHSIIELVWHMTSWRTYVTKKLTGFADYKVTDEQNFPQEKNWEECLAQLDESQRQLLVAIEKFPEEKLGDLVPAHESSHTFYMLLHGIVHHDLYHTGQIMLIKKATADAATEF